MKNKRFLIFFAILFLCISGASADPAAADSPTIRSAGFYYGPAPLPDELGLFDVAVIDPAAAGDLKKRSFLPDAVHAYVSLGEVRKNDPHAQELDRAWIKSENETWASHVMDQTSPGWRRFFLDRIVAPIVEKGVRHIFIDTMDSYHLFAKTPEERRLQEAGMVATITELKAKYPDMRIILNRGFEVIGSLKHVVSGMAVESLFRGWHQGGQNYIEVSEKDREWILSQIRRVRDEFSIPVMVIDYVAPAERDLARQTAKKISDLGFIPYITNGQLNMVGISTVEPLPRKVLFLHDGMHAIDLPDGPLHRFGAMPLNYLGYVPEFLDIRGELPRQPLRGRYAGIVSWLDRPAANARELFSWLERQRDDGVPILFLSGFGAAAGSKMLTQFGMKSADALQRTQSLSVAFADRALIGHEMEVLPSLSDFAGVTAPESSHVVLDIVSDLNQHMHAAALTSWGGYALYPFVLREIGESNVYRWIINPIGFFTRALRLPEFPVPDVTTHNGRRLLLAHIDGDGAISRTEMNPKFLAAKTMLEEIFKRYRIPTTVSVIEGETSVKGLYPDLSPSAEQIYREIFALPHVEPASHSFSHPFYWSKAAKNTDDASYHLNIPGYSFSVHRETLGSLDYVNRLSPANKTGRVFLWTGDCNPDTDALSLLDRAGISAMNGGDTVITRENPSWTAIGPIGVQKEGFFQVYAPNQNENMYTDLWTQRFYGYERAIETFQLTDRPYRFKPINIYYHMYSATKPASLRALRKVYDYALKQDVVAVYASEYIRKAHEFNRIAVGRTERGYRVAGAREIRELRIPRDSGYPSLAGSRDVIGFADHEQSRYLHLAPARMHDVVLTGNPERQVFVESINADITQWTPVSRGADFSFVSHQPLVKLRLGNSDRCSVRVNGAVRPPRMPGSGIAEYEIKGKEDVLQAGSVRCAD